MGEVARFTARCRSWRARGPLHQITASTERPLSHCCHLQAWHIRHPFVARIIFIRVKVGGWSRYRVVRFTELSLTRDPRSSGARRTCRAVSDRMSGQRQYDFTHPWTSSIRVGRCSVVASPWSAKPCSRSRLLDSMCSSRSLIRALLSHLRQGNRELSMWNAST